MNENPILDERPTTVRDLADWIGRFVDQYRPFFAGPVGPLQWNPDGWMRSRRIIARWAEIITKRIDPDRSAELQFAPVVLNHLEGPFKTSQRYFGALATLEIELHLWADEVALFDGVVGEDTWVLAPGGQFTAWLLLDTILAPPAAMTIVDPYVDLDVLSLVARRSEGQRARVLTDELRRDKIAGDVTRLRQEHANVEIRFLPAPDLPHDRFLLAGDSVYLSGASFKDAGRRMSIVIRVSLASAADAIRTEVDRAWGKATP